MLREAIPGRYHPGQIWINHLAGRFYTFALASAACFTMMLSAYTEAFRATHLAVALSAVLALHLLWHRRISWTREFTLYFALVVYILVALLWTRDLELAMNTVFPATNFMLAMILFGSFMRFHDPPTALLGAIFGFACGAAVYTLTQGFPLHRPDHFSYNAIAGMYLFGLFVTAMYGSFRRSRFVLPGLAVIILLHIVATTSIKNNLGVALGLAVAGMMYSRHFRLVLRRQLLVLLLFGAGLGFAVASSHDLTERMQNGFTRLAVGVRVLQAREDVSGYSGFGERQYWRRMGLEGWEQNYIFGYGAEAFRDDYGITSHSTPIDLLYNFGLIGLCLFYGLFTSLGLRLLDLGGPEVTGQRAVTLAGMVCYSFVSLSGTMHYNLFIGAFFGISATLITRPRTRV